MTRPQGRTAAGRPDRPPEHVATEERRLVGRGQRRPMRRRPSVRSAVPQQSPGPRPSEAAVHVQLQHIDTQRRSVDGIGGHVLEAEPDMRIDREVVDERVALGVGAAEMKVLVIERVDDRLTLEIAITHRAAPGRKRPEAAGTEGDIGAVAAVTWRDIAADALLHLGTVETDVFQCFQYVAHRIARQHAYVAYTDEIDDAEI